MSAAEYREPDASYPADMTDRISAMICNKCGGTVWVGDDGWACDCDAAMFPYADPALHPRWRVVKRAAIGFPGQPWIVMRGPVPGGSDTYAIRGHWATWRDAYTAADIDARAEVDG